MSFGLTIGTPRALKLQQTIQDELTKQGLITEGDSVMAEYITIMIINDKTADQITSEMKEIIGPDYPSSFTDWLFEEAARGTDEAVAATSEATPSEPAIAPSIPQNDAPQAAAESSSSSSSSSRRPPNAPRSGVYQHTMSQVLPPSSKRSASARSPSPGHPNKSRRTDLPTGPRAMLRDGNSHPNQHSNPRSLLDRVGGPASRNIAHDEIQARIDNIVNNSPDQQQQQQPMMIPNGYPNMGGMEMAPMGVVNPLMLQEMMMNQMALMAQLASTMGTPGYPVPGFPMQGVMPPPGDMGMFQNGVPNNFQGPPPANSHNANGRGRGATRGGRGGRGRGGSVAPSTPTKVPEEAPVIQHSPPTPTPGPIVAPTPIPAAHQIEQPLTVIPPSRPQSPTLCKFTIKCTNPGCRFSHPSPVATVESGVVLSTEACPEGLACKDKDCVKSHASPAILTAPAAAPPAPAPPSNASGHSSAIPCRYGLACTRPGCMYSHPTRASHYSQPCRFGAGCTRASCPFQHPEGRVLPNSFHRGLSTSGSVVSVQSPETGSIGPSHHRSVTFNNPAGNAAMKEKLEKQVKELEEKKGQAEKAMKEAEAAASKKDGNNPLAITA